ncbi:replication initiator protein A [Staphylococcus aureus]
MFLSLKTLYRKRTVIWPFYFYTIIRTLSKIAYALLKDRLDLSIKNNWFDENGDIFFIYTNEKLKTILNCQNAKLVKIKKELTEVNLLEQIRCGQGKPNKLYLMNPEITKEDIYEIEKQEENVDEPCHDDEVRKSNTNDTDISNTDINDTELNDTTTTKTETNSSGSREKYLTTLLKDELSIKPTKAFIEKIADLSKDMTPDLLEYAIKYASENGNNPKQYLAKILEVWSKNNIFNLEQAQNFSVKSNINSLKSKEKTPRWITHPEEFKLKEENDLELAAEAQAFKEHLIRKKRYFK